MVGYRIWNVVRKAGMPWALTIALLVGNGCSVALRDSQLAAPPRQYSDPIAMRSRAEGIGQQVGWGRFTVFSIGTKAVRMVGDGNEEVMKQVRRALEHVGYKVEVVHPQARVDTPVLSCRAKKFWFNNYTWAFPFVPTWGGMQLELTLLSADGKVLWSREFTGSGRTLNFFNGYTIAANKAMKQVLDQMVEAFAGDEFHRVLKRE